MASYELVIRRSAEKEIRAVPRQDRTRIVDRIHSLAANPRPHDCKKLSSEESYRVRVGAYRVVYTIDDVVTVVEVVPVAHRKEVYR